MVVYISEWRKQLWYLKSLMLFYIGGQQPIQQTAPNEGSNPAPLINYSKLNVTVAGLSSGIVVNGQVLKL